MDWDFRVVKKNEVMRDAVAHFEGQGYKSGERDIEEIRGRKGRKGKGRDETERGERREERVRERRIQRRGKDEEPCHRLIHVIMTSSLYERKQNDVNQNFHRERQATGNR